MPAKHGALLVPVRLARSCARQSCSVSGLGPADVKKDVATRRTSRGVDVDVFNTSSLIRFSVFVVDVFNAVVHKRNIRFLPPHPVPSSTCSFRVHPPTLVSRTYLPHIFVVYVYDLMSDSV